jgi:leader peptidase (prepilin peptidase)/N-methyltransferase
VVFTETELVLPDRSISYGELLYRKTDMITFEAKMVELIDRCYKTVQIRLTREKLEIGDEALDPEQVPHLEAITDRMILPREAMGLGDVKFMAAIGAFLGWKATLFSLMVSSIIGAFVGVILILIRRQEWSSKLPYGPYIALAAIIWMFGGHKWLALLFQPQFPY